MSSITEIIPTRERRFPQAELRKGGLGRGGSAARLSADTKRATRASLLVAAAEEFGRVGFARANVDAISITARCAKGTIYNHFPSKEELFLAVVKEASAQAAASVAALNEAPARERLAAILAGFCVWASEHDSFARVLVRKCLMGTPELQGRMAEAEQPLLAAVEAILREGARRGELREDMPAERLALAIAGLTDLALAQHWSSDGTSPALAEIPELVGLLLGAPAPARAAT